MNGGVEELFYKPLLVTVKSPDREERKCRVYVAVEIHSVVTPVHRKELVVRLTDEKDLFFLYTLKLAEEDFQGLKVQQGLLVDFGAFPQKFIDLLELSLIEENKDVPKFILHLVSVGAGGIGNSAANLNVIETNPFKHLTHLSLKFLPGSDADVKKYLADCLKTLKEQNQTLLMKFEHTESDLSLQLRQTREALSARIHELDNLKSDWTSRTNDLTVRHAQEMTSEREKALQNQNSLQQRYEREKREMEQAHIKIVKQLESRAYELEAANKDLTDYRYKAEANIRELKSKLATSEEEHTRAKQDVQSLRKENAKLDGDQHEKEKIINQLKTRLAVMEQELKDKEQVLTKSSDLLGTEQQNKKRYEDDLDKKTRHIGKLESSVKTMSEELIKANEIIKKLQKEMQNQHGKLKLRNQVVTEQEKLLGEKNKDLEAVKKELDQVQSTLRQKEDENKKLNESLDTTMQKLEESRQLLKTNENVINWLNKQVTEVQLSTQKYGGTHGPFELNSTASSTNTHRASAGLHNFGNQPYGLTTRMSTSGSSYPSSAPPPQQTSVPRQQIQYQPGPARKTGLPMPVSRTSPVRASIPEEPDPRASPIFLQTSQGEARGPKAGGDAFLDAKYLQKSEEKPAHVPVRTSPLQIHFSESASSSQAPPVRNLPSVRMSKDILGPKHTTARPNQTPSLATAYFAGQGKIS